jgi:CubicO group peptidase (beta-lactamase class C family)
VLVTGYSHNLESARESHGVTGASLAYWDGEHLHTAAAGKRNSVTGDPVTTDTVMHIGSIAKILNAVLMMQLVDEGQLRLEDPVIAHLPELRLRDMEALAKITCEMLLNHTSGINCDILPDNGPDNERIVDAIARCADLGQLHQPGGGPSYCNIATVIAGYLVQKLRGASWYSLVEDRLYAPLGLERSLSSVADVPRFRVGVGDVTDPGTGRLVQARHPFYAQSFAPCGTTLMMSASDLVTFARCLLNGGMGVNGERILSADSAMRMRMPTAKMVQPAGWSWGLSWMLMPGGLLSHSGGGPGICSSLYAHPETGRALVLLTNCDRWEALKPSVIAPILRTWTPEIDCQVERDVPIADIELYAGVYENQMLSIEVLSHDGGLQLRTRFKMRAHELESLTSYPAVPLHPLGDDTFVATQWLPGMPATHFQFVDRDSTGHTQNLGFMYRLMSRV